LNRASGFGSVCGLPDERLGDVEDKPHLKRQRHTEILKTEMRGKNTRHEWRKIRRPDCDLCPFALKSFNPTQG